MLQKTILSRIKLGIFISGLCVFAQLYLFQALLPDLCTSFGIDISHSSWAVSLSTLGMAVGLFLYAFIADALPRKIIMVRSNISASILTIIIPWLPNFGLILFVNFIKGICLSGVTAVALAYLSEEVKIANLGLVIGLYLTGNTVGGMIGRTGALLISHISTWQIAVTVMGVFCLLLGVLFYYIFPSSRNFKPNEPIYKLKRLKMFLFLKDKQLLALYVLATVIMSCFVAVYNLVSFQLTYVYHLSTSMVAGVFLMYLVGVYASMVAGKWADKFTNQNIVWKLLLLYLVSIFTMFIPNLMALMLGLAGITFAFFATHTLATKMVSQRVIASKSTATSLYWLFYYVGSSFMSFWASSIFEQFGWNKLILFLSIVLSIGLLLSIYLQRNYKQAIQRT